MKSHKGFTLIELLVVVSVLGALSGILIGVINPEKQRQTAEDGTKRSTLYDYALAIESYRVAEGKYPDEGSSNDPLDSTYIAEWLPEYKYNANLTTDIFSVHVQKSSDEGFLKYRSSTKEISECLSTTANINNINECIE